MMWGEGACSLKSFNQSIICRHHLTCFCFFWGVRDLPGSFHWPCLFFPQPSTRYMFAFAYLYGPFFRNWICWAALNNQTI